MKKLLLLFSLLLSFNSFGYVKVNEDTSDNSYYIDFTTVKKVEDYVFWWEMRDNIKEDDAGFLSSQTYYKGDCNLSRRTINALYRYTENKRGGDGVDMSFNGMYNLEETLGWTYPPPDSVGYDNLKIVCKLVEELSPANRNRKLKEVMYEYASIDWGEGSQWDAVFGSIKNQESSGSSNDVEDQTIKSTDEIIIEKGEWVRTVAELVTSNWRYQGAEDDWNAEVYIVQDRDGTIVAVDVRNSNVGNSSKAKVFEDSIRRAVYKSSPLPRMDDAYFDKEFLFIFNVN